MKRHALDEFGFYKGHVLAILHASHNEAAFHHRMCLWALYFPYFTSTTRVCRGTCPNCHAQRSLSARQQRRNSLRSACIAKHIRGNAGKCLTHQGINGLGHPGRGWGPEECHPGVNGFGAVVDMA